LIEFKQFQALAYLQVLQYSDELIALLESKVLLTNGSQIEMELRGCSIKACDVSE
jgi:hypothetical protein